MLEDNGELNTGNIHGLAALPPGIPEPLYFDLDRRTRLGGVYG